MQNASFKLDAIDCILNKDLQPWHSCNSKSDPYYREQLRATAVVPMPQNLKFSVEMSPHLLFTPRIQYYCHLTDNAVASHLRQCYAMLDIDSSEQYALYLLKITRESVKTLLADCVDRCESIGISLDDDFIHNRAEKEYLVILHYMIASLARCWMELQEHLRYVINDADLYSIEQFYTSYVGWRNDPIAMVIATQEDEDSSKEKRKINTCSFNYINSDAEERNRCLTDFYNRLVHYGLIPQTSCLNQLLKVFSGCKTTATLEWTGKKHVLKFIILKLMDKKVLTVYPDEPAYTHWYVVTCRFTMDGKPMPNLSSETRRKGDEAMIDEIVSLLA